MPDEADALVSVYARDAREKCSGLHAANGEYRCVIRAIVGRNFVWKSRYTIKKRDEERRRGGGKGKGNGEKGGENVIDGRGGPWRAVVAEGNRRRGHHYPTIIRPRPNHCNPYFILRRAVFCRRSKSGYGPRRLQAQRSPLRRGRPIVSAMQRAWTWTWTWTGYSEYSPSAGLRQFTLLPSRLVRSLTLR